MKVPKKVKRSRDKPAGPVLTELQWDDLTDIKAGVFEEAITGASFQRRCLTVEFDGRRLRALFRQGLITKNVREQLFVTNKGEKALAAHFGENDNGQ
jgi:hypothetical protein